MGRSGKERWLLAWLLVGALAGCTRVRGDETMIEFEAVPEHGEYILGEEVRFRLRISNRGDQAVEIPNPGVPSTSLVTYVVTGPGIDGESRFTPAGLAEAAGELDPEASREEAESVRVEAGSTWEGLAEFTGSAPFSLAGEYHVRASLSAGPVRGQSREASFRIGPPNLSAIHLGRGSQPRGKAEGEVAFLHESGDSKSLYTLSFREIRDDLGEVKADRPIHRADLASEATDLGVPWTSGPFFADLVRWTVWREGNTVRVLSNVSRTPASFEAPEDLSSLVPPPLKSTGGPLDVLALSKDRSRLLLVSFDIGAPDKEPKGRLAWSASLPGKPQGLCAAFTASPKGTRRRLAVVTNTRTGVRISHSAFDQGSEPGPFESRELEDVRIVPGAPVGLFAPAKGPVLVGALLIQTVEKKAGKTGEKAEKIERAVLAEVSFPEDPKAPGPRFDVLDGLPGLPVAGGVLYVDDGKGGLNRRQALVALENGDLYKVTSSGSVEAVSLPAPPPRPFLLAPGREFSYVVCSSPGRGPFLEPF